MAKKFGNDDKENKRDERQYYANRICASPMCQKPGVAKDNTTGYGQWYCAAHAQNPNAAVEPAHFEEDWREPIIRAEREAHPERERQPDESRADLARRSLDFMRKKIVEIGR